MLFYLSYPDFRTVYRKVRVSQGYHFLAHFRGIHVDISG